MRVLVLGGTGDCRWSTAPTISSDARTSCRGGSALDGRECQWEPATFCGAELMSMTSDPDGSADDDALNAA